MRHPNIAYIYAKMQTKAACTRTVQAPTFEQFSEYALQRNHHLSSIEEQLQPLSSVELDEITHQPPADPPLISMDPLWTDMERFINR